MKNKSIPTIYSTNGPLNSHGSQIYTFNFLSGKEALALLEYSLSKEPLSLSKHKKTKYIAKRDNYRSAFKDVKLADSLFFYLKSTLEFNFPGSIGLNPDFRLYKYEPGQEFGPHYDESAKFIEKHGKYTILIYLSGLNHIPSSLYGNEVLEGGETTFFGKNGHIKIAPEAGLICLHAQGQDCLLHQGDLVKAGIKWVLRTDLMFV